MEARSAGLLLVVAGVVVIVIGALVFAGLLGWFGRLPGDIRMEGENVRVYVPLASMLLISIVLSLALALFSRLR
jgi:NAD/NADP transhydrogenase beta subunit